MKDGLTAALVVGLGYFGIKGIKDRNYRKHLVKEYGAEEGCPKCGDVEDYFINECCDTPNCFYCGDECYVADYGKPINEDHAVNCTEHECCTQWKRLYGAESFATDYTKPMPTQHWMSELAYVQRFIENLHDNYYSMIPEHLHDSLDKCYDIMKDMVKDSRKAEAAESFSENEYVDGSFVPRGNQKEGFTFYCAACDSRLPLKLRNRSLKIAQEFGMGTGEICRPCVKGIKK